MSALFLILSSGGVAFYRDEKAGSCDPDQGMPSMFGRPSETIGT